MPDDRSSPHPYNPRAVARYAPAALVAALLMATALAFVYTESLKLTPSPILGTRVSKIFSPVCDCDTGTAEISFRLRQGDSLDLEIIDGNEHVVRHLVVRRHSQRGRVLFTWDGRDDAGAVVSEGVYRPRVRLHGQHRTIILPNPIRVDTTPPRAAFVSIGPRVFSPDGDNRHDRVIVRYRVSERAHVRLLVDGRSAALNRGTRTTGRIDWYGKVAGVVVPAGSHRLRLEARDVAGNLGPPTPPKTVVIRYIALGRTRIPAVAGRRIAVLVLTDATRYTWKLGARTGDARPGTLRIRAPQRPGRFTLTVTANGHAARAAVAVRAAP
jgi:hypothetical protein